ncbi:hypothetical protein DX116_05270 [Aeromicrobium endophyticum]|uniref:DUF6916 domain-containing protein n=1 Tax=Aeromicrobium endophyticum TaxID=2292704 RepID=A0A371PAQ0_9ACTN|nr:hypothetical protein DX116_05270 [Aeromicrobium endophyticum]
MIRGGVVVLGAAALGFDTVLGGAATAAPSRSDYASSIGEIFEASDRRGTVRLRLTHADDMTAPGASKRSQTYALIFEPVEGDRPDDGIYALRRRGVPTHDLFVSAVGPDKTLQAIVNGTV